MSQTFLEDIPEFLEIQRNSFLRILDTGLIEALEKINPISTTSGSEVGLLFYPKDYVLVLPENTIKECFLQGKTYGCKIYVPAVVYETQKENYSLADLKNKSLPKGKLSNQKKDLSFLKNKKAIKTVSPFSSINGGQKTSIKTLTNSLDPKILTELESLQKTFKNHLLTNNVEDLKKGSSKCLNAKKLKIRKNLTYSKSTVENLSFFKLNLGYLLQQKVKNESSLFILQNAQKSGKNIGSGAPIAPVPFRAPLVHEKGQLDQVGLCTLAPSGASGARPKFTPMHLQARTPSGLAPDAPKVNVVGQRFKAQMQVQEIGFLKKLNPKFTFLKKTNVLKSNSINFALKSRQLSKKEWVCVGVLPLMTPRGHFIINGSHRIVVSQMSRAPGLYYQQGEKLQATIVPSKGAWLRISLKMAENGEIKIWVRITPQRKMPYKIFIETYKHLEHSKGADLSQSKFLNLTYQSINSKIKHFDKHYAIGVISGQINRTLLNLSSYTLGSLGRKRINDRLGINEKKGYITSKDISFIKNNLIKLLDQNSTELHDDIDHLQNRRVKTCGELLQAEIEVGMGRLKKAITKQLDECLNPNSFTSLKFSSNLQESSIKKNTTSFQKKDVFNAGSLTYNPWTSNASVVPSGYLDQRSTPEAQSPQSSIALDRRGHMSQDSARAIGAGLMVMKNAQEPKVLAENTCTSDVDVLPSDPCHVPMDPTTQAQESAQTYDPRLKVLQGFGNTTVDLSFFRLKSKQKDNVFLPKELKSFYIPKIFKKIKNVQRSRLFQSPMYWPQRVGVNLALKAIIDRKRHFLKNNGFSFDVVASQMHRLATSSASVAPTQNSDQKSTPSGLAPKVHVQVQAQAPQVQGSKVQTTVSEKKISHTQQFNLIWSPSKIVGTKAFAGALREFFGSNPLSQYMDQTNPLAEITHKRRLSSLGPGGVDRASAGIAIRGIHPSHYGRICPIETPEGKNAGLVNSMTMWTRVNKDGFLETPYLKVKGGSIMSHEKNLAPQWNFNPTKNESQKTRNLKNVLNKTTNHGTLTLSFGSKSYLPLPLGTMSHAPLPQRGTGQRGTIQDFNGAKIVSADLNMSESSFLPNIPLPSRDGSEHSFGRQKRNVIDFCGVSPMQNISVATSLIPFLEHDDATRALMGSNMQRQAVPLLKAQGPLVRTGLEGKVVGESGHALQAIQSGIVSIATRSYISIDTFCSKLSLIPNTFTGGTKTHALSGLTFGRAPYCTEGVLQGQASFGPSGLARAPSVQVHVQVQASALQGHEPLALDPLLSGKTLKLSTLLKKTLLPNLPSKFCSKDVLPKGFAPWTCSSLGPKRHGHYSLFFRQNLKYITHIPYGNLKNLQLKKNDNAPKQAYGHKNTLKNSNPNIESIVQLKQIWRKNFKINRERTIQTLQGYTRSNQATICVQRPAVTEGHWVQKGDLVGDCSASRNGVLALGQNIVVAYLPMEGFNFEDAIVVSDRLVHEELYTSIHVQRVEFDLDAVVKQHIPPKIKLKKQKSAYKTTQQDWITLQNPHLLKSEKKALNSLGIIKVGSWVGPGDVLVSKVFPVERKIAPSRHLLLAVFQEKKTKTLDTDDTSLRVPKGIHGRVINVKIVGNGIIIPTKWNPTNEKKFGKLLTNKIQTQNIEMLAGLALDQSEECKPPVNFAPARIFGLAKTFRSYAIPMVFGVSSFKKRLIEKASLKDVSLGTNLQIFDKKHTLDVAKDIKQSPQQLHAINAKNIPFDNHKFTTLEARNPPSIKLFASFKVGGPKGLTPYSQGNPSGPTGPTVPPKIQEPMFQTANPLPKVVGNKAQARLSLLHKSHNLNVQGHKPNYKRFRAPVHDHIINKQLSGPKPLNHKTWAKAWVKTRTSLSSTPSQVFDTWPGSWLFGNPQQGLGQYRSLIRSSGAWVVGPCSAPGGSTTQAREGATGGPKTQALENFTVQSQKPNNSLRFGTFEKQQGISFTTNQEVLNNTKIKKLEKSKKAQEYKIVQIRIYIAERKKLQVGDKMSGRHGNKGIVSTILPREDMPYLPDGTCVDMVLNPLGIPSRMNVGQVFECLLGLAASVCGEIIGHTPFDEMYGPEASRSLVYLFLYVARLKARKDWLFQPNFPGKTVLFDGRTGTPFEQWVTVGRAYMLKLIHMVDEKIHARSIGPRSLVTQQPVKGRARGGGQRLGEMELWALEGFGAAYTLQEILTVKSDDVTGRENVENSIIFAKATKAHIPETFRMMLFELRCLCLNVELNQNC